MLEANNWKSIIEILSAALAPAVAILVGFISYRQFQLDRSKHRLELYDRRLVVFEEVKKFLSFILREGSTNHEQLILLISQTNQATFLFDDEVSLYIDNLYKKGLQFVASDRKLHGENSLPVGRERNNLVDVNSDQLQYFTDQFEISKNLFKKYLKFNQI